MALTVSKLHAMLPAAEPEHTTACTQQLEETRKLLSAHLAQQMKETSEILTQQVARILKGISKECSALVELHIAKSFGRFSAPAYVSPPLYLTQRPPQIRYIYVYIDDLPGLN
jgi:hypothetical protein